MIYTGDIMKTFGILPGKPMPLGATPTGNVVNFSIFTRNGKNVILDIYEDEDDDTPCFSYEFDPEINRTGDLQVVNSSFKTVLSCPRCGKKFWGFVRVKMLYDGISVSKRITQMSKSKSKKYS